MFNITLCEMLQIIGKIRITNNGIGTIICDMDLPYYCLPDTYVFAVWFLSLILFYGFLV